MITDYFLLRHTYLDVDELYNPPAFIATEAA